MKCMTCKECLEGRQESITTERKEAKLWNEISKSNYHVSRITSRPWNET